MNTFVFVFTCIRSSVFISSSAQPPATTELADSHWLRPLLRVLCVAGVRRLSTELGDLFRLGNFWVKILSWICICGSYIMCLLQVGFGAFKADLGT